MNEQDEGLCDKGEARQEWSRSDMLGRCQNKTCEKSASSDRESLQTMWKQLLLCTGAMTRTWDAFERPRSIFFEYGRQFGRALNEQSFLQSEATFFLFCGLIVVPLLSLVIVGTFLAVRSLFKQPKQKRLFVIRKRRFSLCCWRRSMSRTKQTRKWPIWCILTLLSVHFTCAVGETRLSGIDFVANNSHVHEQTGQVENSLTACFPPFVFDTTNIEQSLGPSLDSYVLLDELGSLSRKADEISLMQTPVHPGVLLWSCTLHRDPQLTIDAHTMQTNMVQTPSWVQVWIVHPAQDWQIQHNQYPIRWDPRDCIKCALMRRQDVPQSSAGRGPYLVHEQPRDPSIFNARQFLYFFASLTMNSIALLVHRYQGNQLVQRFSLTVPRASGGIPVSWYFDQLHQTHRCRANAWCRMTSRGRVAWWHERIFLESLSFVTMEELYTDPLDPGATCLVQNEQVSLLQVAAVLWTIGLKTSEGEEPLSQWPR